MYVRTYGTNDQFLPHPYIISLKFGAYCCGSMAERWWLKPEDLGLIPSSTTFLSFPLPFQWVFGQ